MRIDKVTVRLVRLPLEESLLGGAPFAGMQRDFVTVQIATTDGIEGIGVTCFGGALLAALKQAVEAFGSLIVGDNPNDIEAILRKLGNASSHCGPGGIAALALSPIDVALWDIRGKAQGLPLARLLSSRRDRVPAYASGALMRNTPTGALGEAALKLVQMGYTQIKTQMALEGASIGEEIERIRIVRDAVGPDVQVMADVNQRWSVAEAMQLGTLVEDYGLAWLEDVTAHDDFQGQAAIAAALSTPVCGGEFLYGIGQFRQLIAHRAVDIVMIDLLRVGGITAWMKVAAMAEAVNYPVVSHLLPEIHVHLVAAAPNATVVEYMPWTWRLFEDPPKPVNGFIQVPAKPGLGLSFAPDLFTKYAA